MNHSQMHLFEIPWPHQDLQQHPQLAILSALFSSAELSRLALLATHHKPPDNMELTFAFERLLDTLARLIEALHGYHQELRRAASPGPVVPRTWSPQEANCVFEFLHRVADAVWDVHEKELIKMEIHKPCCLDDDIPF